MFGECTFENVLTAELLNIDLILDNIIKTENGYTIIDYEFVIKSRLPINYIIARTVFNIYYKFDKILSTLIPQEEMFEILGIKSNDAQSYWDMEKSFQQYLFKDANYRIGKQYHKEKIYSDKTVQNKNEKQLLKLKIGKRIYKITKTKV